MTAQALQIATTPISVQVLQNVSNVTFLSATSVTLTTTATAIGSSIVVECATFSVTTLYTSFTVTDNKSNTYTTQVTSNNATDKRTVAVLTCFNAIAGVTSIVITPNGGTGGIDGVVAAQEVTGIGAIDNNITGAFVGTGTQTLTMTLGAADTSNHDFVVGATASGNGSTACNLSNPVTTYTTAAIQQNDSAFAAGAIYYRINTTVATDSIAISTTNSQNGSPGCLISLK